MIHQTKEGIWVITGDSHHTGWITDSGRLDHDRATIPAIKKYIPQGGVVVDGGAHIGTHSGFYLDCVGPEGTVISFEPGMDAYHCLVNNCPAAQSHKLALGSGYGIYRMIHGQNYGGAYLSADKDISGYPVVTVPLDAFELPRVSFLKLDVEGFEIQALFGAEETIERCKPTMLIEVNEGALGRQGATPTTLYGVIETMGYSYQYLFPEHHMNMPQTDIICFPK